MTKKARSRPASLIALADNDPTPSPSPPSGELRPLDEVRARGPPSDELRLLTKRDVCELVGRSYQCLWLWMRNGKFPRALDLHGRPVWRASDIKDWIAALPQRRFKGD
jgi:predicted DNA-binding transcriptional regulator AlpA